MLNDDKSLLDNHNEQFEDQQALDRQAIEENRLNDQFNASEMFSHLNNDDNILMSISERAKTRKRIAVDNANYSNKDDLIESYFKEDNEDYQIRSIKKRKANKIHNRSISSDKQFECELCFKKFGSSKNLAQHKTVHSNLKLYQCDFCSRSFKYAHSLVTHTRTHTGEKPFSCDVCERKFSDQRNLKSHQRIHASEKSNCSLDRKEKSI